jgi:hypothetical protein
MGRAHLRQRRNFAAKIDAKRGKLAAAALL